MNKNILMIDNFDSFTFNLVDEFEKRGFRMIVYRNDTNIQKIEEIIQNNSISLIIISPGPSHPRDAGNSISIITRFGGKIPIFGVCLGHQAIIEAFGGKVDRAGEIVHGKASLIEHDKKTIFKGINSPFSAARYHSLAGLDIPSCLEISAKKGSIVMAIRHKEYKDNFIEGVQFHPESILSPEGVNIIENIIQMI
ncbi:MAG: aminodeoxychorismate/anthranilate synthase component II [Nanoarchaeota archaeon]|nr:aminodeoxychorismate/anthranilate synthase component II [Nanoarchaeota archaeon]